MIGAHSASIGILLRCGAGCTGNLESDVRVLQHISRVLPRFVELSNRAACDFNVSLGPDGARIIFPKITPGEKFLASKRAAVPIGELEPTVWAA